MGSFVFEAAGQIQVILQTVFGARRIHDVPGVTNTSFSQRLGAFAYRADAGAHGVNKIERVKNAEHIDPGFGRFLDETHNHIVGISGVPHGIGTPNEHLQQHIRNMLTNQFQTLPGAFV